jgi:ABC-2 type transport system permease protein
MWFRSVYLKSVRDARIAILGWGVGIGLLMYVVLIAVKQVVATAAARAALASLASSFTWLAEPVSIGTPGGYATWKYGPTILILAIWPLLIGSRMLRGEEERGALDVLLSLPRTRLAVAVQKIAAMWTALAAMGVLIALLTYAGGQSTNATYGFGGSLLFALNLILACGVFGSISLFVSQFTQERRTASGIAGGSLVFFIILDMVHRVIPGTEWISRLSPVYYYNLSKPLIPSYGTNLGALLILVGISLVLTTAAVALFVTRDVAGVVALPAFLRPAERPVSPERALPANAWSLRSVYTRGLAVLAGPTLWWTIGIAGFAALMVVVVQQTEQKLITLAQSSPFFQSFITKLGGGDTYTNATLMSSLFTFIPLLLMAFAITGASRWASDEEDGQLDLVITTPRPRYQVILGRFGALATATIVISLLTLGVTAATSALTGIKLDTGNLVGAGLSLIPLGLLVAAIGYLLSGWLNTAIDTGLLSFLLVIWFVITFIGQDLGWPSGTQKLSAFYYYGTPILNGVSFGSLLFILVLAAVALVLATVRFAQKDIVH